MDIISFERRKYLFFLVDKTNKTKQNKTKQNKTKQNKKAPQHNNTQPQRGSECYQEICFNDEGSEENSCGHICVFFRVVHVLV